MKFDLQECPDLEYSAMNYMTEGCKTWLGWANVIFWRFYTIQSLTILITIKNSIHAFTIKNISNSYFDMAFDTVMNKQNNLLPISLPTEKQNMSQNLAHQVPSFLIQWLQYYITYWMNSKEAA
jgi:hypothetical protein